jgi:hypothetical protein
MLWRWMRAQLPRRPSEARLAKRAPCIDLACGCAAEACAVEAHDGAPGRFTGVCAHSRACAAITASHVLRLSNPSNTHTHARESRTNTRTHEHTNVTRTPTHESLSHTRTRISLMCSGCPFRLIHTHTHSNLAHAHAYTHMHL